MLLNFSKHNKKYYHFKFLNDEFEDILWMLLTKFEYDYVVLKISSFELESLNKIEYQIISFKKQRATIKINKTNIINIMNSFINDDLRSFELDIYFNNKKCFNIISENYGEFTSIVMEKSIDKKILELLKKK